MFPLYANYTADASAYLQRVMPAIDSIVTTC
jgi:hypothetical protein